MKQSVLLVVLLPVALALGVQSPAFAYVGLCCSKCGGNMPLNIPGAGVAETHEFRIKVSPSFMHMDGLTEGTSDIDPESLLGMPIMMGNPTGKYMAVPTAMDMSMLNVSMGYSFTDDFFAGVMLMFQQNDMDMQFNDMMAMTTQQSGFTMESEGVADTMLMAKYRLFTDDPLIPTRQASFFMGLSLPTGSIDEKNATHPVAMRQNELLPYGMQLGSGTFDPSVGIVYSGSKSPYWWGANTIYTARVHENKRDYRLGNELRFDLYGMYQLNYMFVFEAQLNAKHTGNIRGEMDEVVSGESGHVMQGMASSPYTTPLWDTRNYGGDELALTLGVQWQPASLNILSFQVGMPLYQDLNGVQLKDDYRVMLTWYIEIPTKKSRRSNPSFKDKSTLGF